MSSPANQWPSPAQYAEVVGQLRGSPPDQIAAHFERLAASRVPYQGHLLLGPRDELLACGQIALEDGLAGLYDIFTPEAQRGRDGGRPRIAEVQQVLRRGAGDGQACQPLHHVHAVNVLHGRKVMAGRWCCLSAPGLLCY